MFPGRRESGRVPGRCLVLTDGARAVLASVGHAAATLVLARVGDTPLDRNLTEVAREALRAQADGPLAGPVLLTHTAVLTVVLRPRAQRTCSETRGQKVRTQRTWAQSYQTGLSVVLHFSLDTSRLQMKYLIKSCWHRKHYINKAQRCRDYRF